MNHNLHVPRGNEREPEAVEQSTTVCPITVDRRCKLRLAQALPRSTLFCIFKALHDLGATPRKTIHRRETSTRCTSNRTFLRKKRTWPKERKLLLVERSRQKTVLTSPFLLFLSTYTYTQNRSLTMYRTRSDTTSRCPCRLIRNTIPSIHSRNTKMSFTISRHPSSRIHP